MPVGAIQTKRMQRRGSITSQGSAADSLPVRPGGLQRRDSGGSMTERTFRSPSPNRPDRPASSHGPYPRYDQDDAPPVPALPTNLLQQVPKRPASVEPRQRMKSPTLKKAAGRVVSLDRGPGTLPGRNPSVRSSQGPGEKSTSEIAAVRSSVNFSRPMSPQNLPSGSPRPLSPRPVKVPGSVDLPASEVRDIQRTLSKTADRPVKKKKKPSAATSGEGSHLSSGSSEQAPSGSAVPISNSASEDPTGKPQMVKKKKKKIDPALQNQGSSGQTATAVDFSDNESVTSEISNTSERVRAATGRSSGVLAKQPSIVREDREAEEEAEQATKPPRRITNTNGTAVRGTPANTSKVVSKDRQHNRSVSQPATQNLTTPAKKERPTSLSPGRAAHFSSQPEYANLATVRHQPPARSVSPAKSAMKNSPSRDQSPAVIRNTLAPSEASDTGSQVSDEGSRTSTKKKKRNVRVSFDDDSVLIGQAAGPMSATDSPVILSPQGKAKPQSWFDLVRDKKRGESESGDDDDEDSVMKPRPALPSFGSVRAQGQKASQPNENSKLAGNGPQGLGFSNDAVLGGIIAKESPARSSIESEKPKNSINDPLPPEVTSVEGTGEHSDIDDEAVEEVAFPLAEEKSEVQQPREANVHVDSPPLVEPVKSAQTGGNLSASVPTIAVQPASPNPDPMVTNRQSWLGMPGDFPSSNDADEKTDAKRIAQAGPTIPGSASSTSISNNLQSEDLTSQIVAGSQKPASLEDYLQNRAVPEEAESKAETESSIYSDAAEDQTDAEGDGFGSINAIVESPVSPHAQFPSQSPPASPSIKTPKTKKVQPEMPTSIEGRSGSPPAEGWERTQSYWSAMSEAQKQQLQRAAMPGAVDESVVQNKTMRGADSMQKKKKKTKKAVQQAETNRLSRSVSPPQAASPTPSVSVVAISQPPNTRNQQPKSTAGGPTPKSRSEVKPQRNLEPAASPKSVKPEKARPVSAAYAGHQMKKSENAPAAKGRPTSMGSPNPGSAVSPTKPRKQKPTAPPVTLARAGSDSSSSFKKARSRTPDVAQYKMKRSMRSSAAEGQAQSQPNDRTTSMSLRSSSPTESMTRRPFSGLGGGTMRSSMRGSSDMSSKPARMSLRAPKEPEKPSRTKSPSRFGFGKSNKAVVPEPKSTSRFSSRFNDSSDEDDNFGAASRSRFADSSDEDEPTALAPVRGIPRRIDEGDSTDLEDSSAENDHAAPVQPVKPTPNNKLASPEGTALASGSLRSPAGDQAPTATMGQGFHAKKAAEKEKKRRSFFSGLGSKKRDDASRPVFTKGAGGLEAISESPKIDDSTPSTPQRPQLSTRGVSNISSTIGQKDSTPSSPIGVSPKNPKLQRRNTPKTVMTKRDISWPLPPPTPPPEPETEKRPRTSDGGPHRPSLVLRQNTVRSEVDTNTALKAAAAKKKAPFWKRAFGRGS